MQYCAGQGIWLGNLLKGYNPVTFMVVANLAFSGLLVSWVMKFADSIMKVSSSGFSISMMINADHI